MHFCNFSRFFYIINIGGNLQRHSPVSAKEIINKSRCVPKKQSPLRFLPFPAD